MITPSPPRPTGRSPPWLSSVMGRTGTKVCRHDTEEVTPTVTPLELRNGGKCKIPGEDRGLHKGETEKTSSSAGRSRPKARVLATGRDREFGSGVPPRRVETQGHPDLLYQE